MTFAERYRKEWGWPEGYDNGTFLSDVIANSWTMGYSTWLGIGYDHKAEVRHWVEEYGICMEDRIVASIMDGTCKFAIDDPNSEERIDYEPDFDAWCRMIDNPNDEVGKLLGEFMEGHDDAETAECLLQCWVYGEVIWG